MVEELGDVAGGDVDGDVADVDRAVVGVLDQERLAHVKPVLVGHVLEHLLCRLFCVVHNQGEWVCTLSGNDCGSLDITVLCKTGDKLGWVYVGGHVFNVDTSGHNGRVSAGRGRRGGLPSLNARKGDLEGLHHCEMKAGGESSMGNLSHLRRGEGKESNCTVLGWLWNNVQATDVSVQGALGFERLACGFDVTGQVVNSNSHHVHVLQIFKLATAALHSRGAEGSDSACGARPESVSINGFKVELHFERGMHVVDVSGREHLDGFARKARLRVVDVGVDPGVRVV